MRVALHTKVHTDRVEEYEAPHREVSEELTTAIRAAGVSEWTIRGGGTDLFHPLEVEDHAATAAEPEEPPVTLAGQARTADLPGVVHDYAAEGSDAGLPVVWEL